MGKIYKVNRLCYINDSNPTPSKDYIDIAINIVPCRENKKFVNFFLGIDNEQQCCEYFGAGSSKVFKKDKKVFVKEIETDVILPKEIMELILKEHKFYEDLENYIAVKVSTRDCGDIYAYVFNEHNSYYSHAVYYTQDELRLDVCDKEYI